MIIGIIPNSSVFYITKNACSGILVDFSYTGRDLASIETNAVSASINVELFNKKSGTCPIISLKSSGPLII